MEIRYATIDDLEEISEIENKCFPKAEAATKESFEKRLKIYPNHFWIMENNGKIVSFVNGMVHNSGKLLDEMFDNANLHDENGNWQMIFGVNTLPEYRKQGIAEKLIKKAIEDAKIQRRKGVILTCKDKLVNYYAKLGFENEGVSDSTHGGVIWYDMKITF